MKWINSFSNSQIPYYIYKLNKGDKILYNPNKIYNRSIVILQGVIYLFKIFQNKEIFPLAILKTNNIIDLECSYETQHYYTIIALDQTYLMSFSLSDIKNKIYIKKQILLNIIYGQKITLKQYELMNQILRHKYIKYRILQLILLLSLEFGIIHENKIIIPFSLSQKNLSIIIGSNKITINQIMNYLSKKTIIKYSTKKIIHIENIFNLQLLFCY
uniref:Global nitrogen transcriptional regulator n=1 Tax=Membranoptera platyphylla TaxID=1204437 RepID=A0A1I9KQK8_9FLOR|nr:global nitrogen transcriptional regulator [Membranoptera platyphylla]AMJ16882.1 global nitrogen transcriptional regulator [Membranoptera platyphylla]